jgi:hypothetical protein
MYSLYILWFVSVRANGQLATVQTHNSRTVSLILFEIYKNTKNFRRGTHMFDSI